MSSEETRCRRYVRDGHILCKVHTCLSECEGRLAYRLYQCPGCWCYDLARVASGTTIECDCGERMTRVDLRDPETSPFVDHASGHQQDLADAVQAMTTDQWQRLTDAVAALPKEPNQ